jgi:DNA-binding winged helix-turn-helix (wHTH) protein
VQFAFGDYVLDGGRRELRRGSEQVALEPQVFDVLLYLAPNRDRVPAQSGEYPRENTGGHPR